MLLKLLGYKNLSIHKAAPFRQFSHRADTTLLSFSHGEMAWDARTPLILSRENTFDLKLLIILMCMCKNKMVVDCSFCWKPNVPVTRAGRDAADMCILLMGSAGTGSC